MLAELFLSFFRIGAFTIGGGAAMVPLMEAEIVNRKQWLSREEFLDIFAVSQATPGLMAGNMSSHIGYKVAGIKGAIVATLGTVLPSLVCILAIAIFFRIFRDNRWVEAAFRGIRPAVVALIALPVFSMARSAKVTWHNVWIPVLSTLLIWLLGVSPVWIIVISGTCGYLYGRYKRQTGK